MQGEKKKYSKWQKYLLKNKDVVGGGCIKDEYGKVVVEEEKVRDVWAAHHEKPLNEEFDWNMNELNGSPMTSFDA